MSAILEHRENLEMSYPQPWFDETCLDTMGERKVSKPVFSGASIPVSTVLRKSVRSMGKGTLESSNLKNSRGSMSPDPLETFSLF